MTGRAGLFVASIALALAAVPAHADGTVDVIPTGAGVRLVVNGKLVTIFRTPNGDASPQERAELAAERLRLLLEKDLSPRDIEARPLKNGWGVFGRGGLLMVATQQEAAERKEAPKATAQRWAANLKTVLAAPAPVKRAVARSTQRDKKPAVTAAAKGGTADAPAKPQAAKSQAAKTASRVPTLGVELASLAVPVGEKRVVALKGTAGGEIGVRVEGEGVLAAAAAEGGEAAVEVTGLAPGKAVVRVTRGEVETAFTAWVKKYAGAVTEAPVAEVTGITTPASLVLRAAKERLLDGVKAEPGAAVKILGAPAGVRALGVGESTEVVCPVSIEGEGYLPVKTEARVKVANIALPPEDAHLLLYSNDPESVREYGTLYEGLVDNKGPVRLLYHHQNRTGRPLAFQIDLINPHDSPVDVQIIEGEAGPFIDTIQVGHRAAEKYMRAASENIGMVVSIPPRGFRTVYSAMVPHPQTVSGIYGFRVMSGDPLVAQVSASDRPVRPELRDDLLESARKEPHMYPTPQKYEEHKYRVGDVWTFIPLGRKPVTGLSSNRKLFGNYGVVYNINVDVSNPTDEMKTIEVVLNPDAGWTRGVFFIDGTLVEAPQISPPAQAVLHTIKLMPGEQRKVRIQGIPVSGSAYPVSLVVRS